MTEPDGTPRGKATEDSETQKRGVDPTVRFITLHTTVTVLATLGVVVLLALLGFPEAAAAVAAVGTAGGAVQVALHPRR